MVTVAKELEQQLDQKTKLEFMEMIRKAVETFKAQAATKRKRPTGTAVSSCIPNSKKKKTHGTKHY